MLDRNKDGNIPEIAREVLAHFVFNPNGADSLEGIARFRLQQQMVDHTVEHVGEALRWLVEHEYLVRKANTGAAPVYRLNEARAADAQRCIGGGSGRSDGTHVSNPEQRTQQRASDSSAAEGLMIQRIRTWLDATLLNYYCQQPTGADDVPGFSRGTAWLEQVLSPSDAPTASDRRLAAAKAAARANEELAASIAGADDSEPVARLQRVLNLTSLEIRALLICLAPELDPKYQVVLGTLNDDLSRRTVTMGLLCALLGKPVAVRRELTSTGGLLKNGLLEGGSHIPYADEPLRLDVGMADWLLGHGDALLAESHLGPVAAGPDHRTPIEWEITVPHSCADDSPAAVLSRTLQRGQWVVLCDPDPSEAIAWLARNQSVVNGRLLALQFDRMLESQPTESQRHIERIVRTLRLLQAVPVLPFVDAKARSNGSSSTLYQELCVTLQGFGIPGVALVPEAEVIARVLPGDSWRLFERRQVDLFATGRIFRETAATAGLELSRADAEWLALTFPFSSDAIARAVALASVPKAGCAETADHRANLARACGRLASLQLPRFARRVDSPVSLSDLVLPEDRFAQLHEIVAHIRCAPQVLKSWGFEPQLLFGRGVAALFHGPSGTGKTMAAQAIARAVGTELYVVDLSRVVSKYIGESEKNLDTVFDEAERGGAVLLFDEADALFGKRSEIKDAHDRYANMEVAYLLQRMEAYSGLAILTTNFRQNMDQAFTRRLRFIIDFPKPDAASREKIWCRCFPKEAPLARDVDLKALARRLELTGGSIRQITLRAAFAASDEQSDAIEMRHVLGAAAAELRKLGMPSAERELAELGTQRREMHVWAV